MHQVPVDLLDSFQARLRELGHLLEIQFLLVLDAGCHESALLVDLVLPRQSRSRCAEGLLETGESFGSLGLSDADLDEFFDEISYPVLGKVGSAFDSFLGESLDFLDFSLEESRDVVGSGSLGIHLGAGSCFEWWHEFTAFVQS